MNAVRFVFCLHNHQPVGNFDSVNEWAYHHAYWPFLQLVEQFPEFRFCLHNSGCLLEWMKPRHPEYFALLRLLVQRGQVELVGGAMYEPILPIWRALDIRRQIELQRRFLEDHFNVDAPGLWLPERVWEPKLAETLSSAGVLYTSMDDSIVREAVPDGDLNRTFKAGTYEDFVTVFPVSEHLRYTIPFQDVDETLAHGRRCGEAAAAALVTSADDGEKFGGWPGTHRHVFQRGWLRRFIKAVLHESEWLHLVHFSEVTPSADEEPVEIPAGTYREMEEWARTAQRIAGLPDLADERAQSVWRYFPARYDEVRRLQRWLGMFAEPEADAHYLRAQCNCSYWHGVFGGLYIPHLRSALYEELARSRAHHAPTEPRVRVEDGAVALEDTDFTLGFAPARGGSLDLLLVHRTPFNWGSTLTRRPEAYHRMEEPAATADGDLAKTIHRPGRIRNSRLLDQVVYDRYERASLIDHFIDRKSTLTDFRDSRETELGDFVSSSYEHTTTAVTVELSRSGSVRQRDLDTPVRIHKTIEAVPDRPAFTVHYSVDAEEPLRCLFGVEWNLTALAPRGPDRWVEVNGENAGEPRSRKRHHDVRSFALMDGWGRKAIRIGLSRPAELWRFGLHTVSRSESGFEEIYQQTVFLPLFNLNGSTSLDVTFDIEFAKLD